MIAVLIMKMMMKLMMELLENRRMMVKLGWMQLEVEAMV